ncbi:transglutaminase domain-containing protein [Streptomyces sp. A7024]|uniref:Transglutaminase domain-containing protein n=1 Tax=Streptomyces coryli TaxID=1128680 RepID=A0A6G4U3Y6_9ACTN|nr:transglutaminase domain-containing protein [Streptomyces coryli]
MSGRARLAVCAAAATLLAGTALMPLTDGAGWYFQAIFLVVMVTGAGALARRVPLARPLTVLAQVVVALLVLTVIFTPGQALAGVIPGPQSIEEFSQLYQEGTDDVSRYAIPAPVSDGIRLLLLSGIAGVALLVDALAVTYRSAAPAGLPLLALYSVAAGLNQEGTRWIWFLLAGSGYLLLLLAEGRERLVQWGRMFGGGAPRTPAAQDPLGDGGSRPVSPVRTGRRIGAMALGIALLTPAVLPELSGGLLDGRTGGGEGPGGGGTVSAVNPIVRLQQSLNQPENREVLRYRTSDKRTDRDVYMRFVALDQFDGTSWTTAKRDIQGVPENLPQPAGYTRSEVKADPFSLDVKVSDWYRQQWLPMPYPALKVSARDGWRYEPEGRSVIGDHGRTTAGAEYQVTSLQLEPTAEQLATAPAAPEPLRREYTRVPDSLPGEVLEQARKITAGDTNDYERALSLQRYFTSNFEYSTEVALNPEDPRAIVKFLRNKEGFCVHFSFTMAAMARTLGIPARVAVGYTPGDAQGDSSMSVGLKDAHAWPELFFQGVGWTRFEPTPTRGEAPDYTLDQTPSGGSSPSSSTPEPSESADASPSPSSSTSDCPAALRRSGNCETDEQAPGADPGSNSGWPGGTATAAAVGILALLVLPALPMLWRIRERRRRLASGDTLRAWRELTDSAWDFGLWPDEAQTPRTMISRLVRFASLDTDARTSAYRAAAAVEQVLYAPSPHPPTTLTDDVTRVRAALSASAGRWTRIRATIAPRSSVRILWSWSRRWSALSERWLRSLRGLRRRPSEEGA